MYLFSVLIGSLDFLVQLSNNLGFDDDDDDDDNNNNNNNNNNSVVCKDNRPANSHTQFK